MNIAEAMLDMSGGGPMPTDDLLQEIDLPDEISTPLQAFSLEHALLRDRRFDDVGPSGYALWYLEATNRARFWNAEAPALRSGLV